MGLRLGSRTFLDLESEREEPRITLVIFWTVLSVMDSVRDSLGDLTPELSPEDLFFASTAITLSPVLGWSAPACWSSLKELDFFSLQLEADVPSLLLAPVSEFKLLHVLSSCFFSSLCEWGRCLSTDLLVKDAKILFVMLWAVEVVGEDSSCSGPSSGIVG